MSQPPTLPAGELRCVSCGQLLMLVLDEDDPRLSVLMVAMQVDLHVCPLVPAADPANTERRTTPPQPKGSLMKLLRSPLAHLAHRTRKPLLVLLAFAGLLLTLTAPHAAASVSSPAAAVRPAASSPVPPDAHPAMAARNIGPNAWDRSTIVIQVMKAGSSAEQTWFHERVSYMRNVAGSTLDIVEGGCVVNMPCIRVYWDFYGRQTWDGLTTEAYTNCLAPARWCRYDGTSSVVTHTTVQFDRSNGIDSFPYNWLQSLTCHELGRALAELQAASGATCMQNATYQYPSLTAAEEQSVRDKYTGLPRRASRSDFTLAG